MAAAGVGTYVYGPRVGFYLLPPSPQRYAQVALDHLDGGLHTDDPRWAHDRAALLETARTAENYTQLYPALQQAARTAGGKHSSLTTPGQGNDGATSATDSPIVVPTVDTDRGVTTVVLPGMTDPSPQAQQRYASTVANEINAAAGNTCGWIVDLRGNTGGTMYPMLSAVTALLPNGPALSFRTRSGAETAVTIQDDGAGLAGRTEVQVEAPAKVDKRPIAVVQDEWTASSGEAVLTAFRGLQQVQTFGAASAGYTSANHTYRLFDGAQLLLTESVYVDRDGNALGEAPVPPDHLSSSADAPGDARSWLLGQGCP